MDDQLQMLAEGVRRKDPAALGSFLEMRKPSLLAFIEHRLGASLRSKAEPADIFQELAIKALRELPLLNLDDRDPFLWLCRLAEQCVVDGHRHFAAGKRATGREVAGNAVTGEGSQDLVALLAASMTSPTQAVVRGERERRLAEAMANLPEEHREVLRLRYVEGRPTREIAERLGKTDAAIRVLLSRLLQKLQELLGPAEQG
jgi:RNA polymerase sigma-70 factor (ECF subfamily)